MGMDSIAGLRIQIADVLAITATLTEDEWQAASRCPGWSVRDVIAHLCSDFGVLVDPSELAERPPDLTVEEGNEHSVAARRTLSNGEVRAEYAANAPLGLATLESFQDPSLAHAE